MRTRYKIDRETGGLVELAVPGLEAPVSAFILPDLDRVYNGGFQSPVDGRWISSRSQLRAHNRANECVQNGDVRGKAVRDMMKKHMKYDPQLQKPGPHFGWSTPDQR